jgi:hypothetical protein
LGRLVKIVLLVLLLAVPPLPAYSVQSHEELIDLNWKPAIRPFLHARFPHATDAELEQAHAFAFGGCAIQDLGYYPFSNEFFSDLAHYVRSADFIRNLFNEAKNPNELAFAIGALSHYVGDTTGHSLAVNPAVADGFPALAKKYGPVVTYDEDPHAHVRTEFAFDIDEISKHRMAPSAYLRHVGLRVPADLLARAFFDTYGLNFEQILGKRRPVVRGYRSAVRSFLPRIAYAETVLHGSKFPADTPGEALRLFQQHIKDADFESQWNRYRRSHAGVGTYLLAGTIFVLPKIGPLSLLAIRGPTPRTHELYLASMNKATASLQQLLATWNSRESSLPNLDLDTGEKVRPGGYRLTDETYAKLVQTITRQPQSKVPVGLKQDIQDYYADARAPIITKRNPQKWAQLQKQLVVLQGMQVVSEPRISEMRLRFPN